MECVEPSGTAADVTSVAVAQQHPNQQIQLRDLPMGILCEIFKRLSLADKLVVAKMYHHWAEAVNSKQFWTCVNLATEKLRHPNSEPLDWTKELPSVLASHPNVEILIDVRVDARFVLVPCLLFTTTDCRDMLHPLRSLKRLEIGVQTGYVSELVDVLSNLTELTTLVFLGGNEPRMGNSAIPAGAEAAQHHDVLPMNFLGDAPAGADEEEDQAQHANGFMHMLPHGGVAVGPLEGNILLHPPHIMHQFQADLEANQVDAGEPDLDPPGIALDIGRSTLSLPHLRELTLGYCCARGTLSLNCPLLERLELIEFKFGSFDRHCICNNLTDITVRRYRGSAARLSTLLRHLERNEEHKHPSLCNLTFENVSILTDTLLTAIGRGLPTLTTLALSSVSINGTGLRASNEAWRSLCSLELHNLHAISGANLETAVNSMSTLQELTIGMMPMVSTLQLESRSLKTLRLAAPQHLTSLTVHCANLAAFIWKTPIHFGAMQLQDITLVSSALKSFHLSRCDNLNSLHIDCPALENITFRECRLKSNLLSHLLQHGNCPRLAALHISCCDMLDSVSVLYAPVLRMLKVLECRSLRSVAVYAPQLNSLTINECGELHTLQVGQSLALHALSLGGCPRLETLHVDAKALRELDIRGCNLLTTLTLDCPALYSIDASMTSGLDDVALSAVTSCPALSNLQLGNCNAITVDGWTLLACATRLTRLELTGVATFEDPSPLSGTLPRLHALLLTNLYQMQPNSLMRMLERLVAPSLTHLNLSGCNLPSGAITTLATGSLPLKFLEVNNLKALPGEVSPAFNKDGPFSAVERLSVKCCSGFDACHIGLVPAITCGNGLRQSKYAPAPTPFCTLKHLQLGSSTFVRAALALPQLVECDLQLCSGLTHLELRCPALKKLLLGASKQANLDTICKAVQGCSALQYLQLFHPLPNLISKNDGFRGVSTLDPDAIKRLRTACPSLQAITLVAGKTGPRHYTL